MTEQRRVPTRRELLTAVSGASFAAISGCGMLGGDDDGELQFDVSIVDANDPIADGGVLELTVVVENVGDSAGREEIVLDVGDIQDSTEVSLEPGDSTEVIFSGRLETDQGEETFDATVQSTAFSDLQRVTVQSPAQYALEIVDITEEVVRGETFQVDVEVSNTGSTRATKAVWLGSQGVDEELDRTQVTVDGGRSETVTLRWDTDEQSDVGRISVNTEDDQLTQSISILSPPELGMIIQGTNAPVLDGETLEIDVRVANQGDVEVTEMVTFEFGGTELDSQEVTVAGGTQQAVTFSYTTTLDDVGERDITVLFGDISKSASVEINQAMELSDSTVVETPEDFAELIEATIENSGETERTAALEGEIQHEEYTTTLQTEFATYRTVIPSGTGTNSRTVTVSPNSEETFLLKIPTDVWEFDPSSKIVDGEVNMDYTHDLTLNQNPETLPTMAAHEKVAIRDKSVNVDESTTTIDAELQNFGDETIDVTVVGFTLDLENRDSPARREQEVSVPPARNEDISISIYWGGLETPHNDYIEIAGVRDNPGTDPEFTTIV